jgi:hypothetical protein
LTHQSTLQALDVLAEFTLKANEWIDWDARSLNAGQLVDMVLKAPLFDLDAICEKIRETGYTSVSRFSKRLNAKLHRRSDPLDGARAIESETRELYGAVQKRFIAENSMTKLQ